MLRPITADAVIFLLLLLGPLTYGVESDRFVFLAGRSLQYEHRFGWTRMSRSRCLSVQLEALLYRTSPLLVDDQPKYQTMKGELEIAVVP